MVHCSGWASQVVGRIEEPGVHLVLSLDPGWKQHLWRRRDFLWQAVPQRVRRGHKMSADIEIQTLVHSRIALMMEQLAALWLLLAQQQVLVVGIEVADIVVAVVAAAVAVAEDSFHVSLWSDFDQVRSIYCPDEPVAL